MQYKVLNKQPNSDMCVVCGIKNDYSLKAEFYQIEGNYVVGLTKGLDEHQSYPNRMHGGLIGALLDEAIGRAIQIDDPDMWGVTTDLNIKYRKPVPLNKPLKVVGKITQDSSRLFIGEGFIEDEEGNLLAQGKATYFKVSVDKIVGGDANALFWEVVPAEHDPQYIDVNNIK